MVSFAAIVAFLCLFGKLPAALSDESNPKVVDFGKNFAVESDEEVTESDRIVWRLTNGQKPTSINIQKRKCQCSGSSRFQCKCCATIKLGFFHVDTCAGFTFDPSAKALDFTVTVDGKTVFKKTIKVNTPVRFCHDIPFHGKDAKLCVGLSDISFQKGHVGACIYIEITYGFFHWKQKLGCVYKDVKPKVKLIKVKDFF